MKQLYKFSILLFLLPALIAAGPGYGKYTKSKKLNKSFTVNKNCMVDIQNEFGNVTITTWDQPTVSIDVTVEVSGNNEERVDRQLREIDVDFNASASKVSARTDAEQKSSSNGSLWNTLFNSDSSNNSNMKINYIVKMPITATLDITNDYGTIVLDRLEGNAKIRCDFGRLDIGQLLGNNNELRFDYTNNSHIDYMKSGTIRADFSSFELYGSEKVDYKGDYTKAKFEDVKKLDFNGDFSTIQVDAVIKIIGRGDYSTIKIGTIQKSVDLNTDFGSIHINELSADILTAAIKSEYTGIKVGFHPNASFKFDIDTEFASIKLSDDLTITRSENDTTDKQRSGYYGNKDALTTINIRSSFGGVSLKRN
ncbi:MAG: hypothetical protein ABF274_10800 [Nonlabens sp.]|uniref:hypothetical protein n=1 Tax=Nonlabens sp. TaxID=1888209 RepID=UPI00321AA3C3